MNQNEYENGLPNEQTETALSPSADTETSVSVTTVEKPKKEKKIREKREWKNQYLLVAFAIPFLIMFVVYVFLGKHPFGNNSVLTLDLQAQYIYYYEAVRRLLTEGGSFLYSWERTLGGEFMGIIAYYMASPFNLILVLFPKHMIVDAVMFIQLAKIGTMGMTFAYYLRKTRQTSDMNTVIFATMYALCGYSVVEMINPMWIDAMVFLPLLTLGIESMVRNRKFVLYTVSLATIFITNYYMGYMCAIFTFFYYIYYFFLTRNEIPQNEGATHGSAVKRFFHSRGLESLVRMGVFSILAAMIAAFFLFSALYSLSFGKSDFSHPNFAATLRFDLLDVFVKMLPGSYDTVRPNGLPVIYSGLLALMLLPIFFASKTISTRKKALSAGFLGLFLVSFSVNTIDLVWHGFSAPNWLNYRYSYLFTFLVIVFACDALQGIKKIPYTWILASGLSMAGLILVVQKLDYKIEQAAGRFHYLDDAKCIIVSLVLILAYLIILNVMKKDGMRRVGTASLAAIVCVEMFASSIITVTDVQMDVGSVRYDNYLVNNGKTEEYSGYNGSIRRIEHVVNEILEKDQSLYRMESTVYRRQGGVNEPMAFGYNGISHSTSTLNADVIALMNKLGYASQSHWTKYLGGTPVSDALLGIKYVITMNDKLDPNLYTVAAQGKEQYKYLPTENMIYAMQNTKALSMVYGVSPAVLDDMKDFLNPPYYSALDLQNSLVNSMMKGVIDTPDVLKPIELDGWDDHTASPDWTLQNCTYGGYTHHHPYFDENGEEQSARNSYDHFIANGNEASITYRFEAEADSPIYIHLPGIMYQGMSNDCEIRVNGRKVTNYYTNETWTVQKLGTFKKGESVEVKIVFRNGDLYVSNESDNLFYYIDYDAMNDVFSRLEYASMYIEDFGNDHIKGTIDLPKGQELIFTTIPYDEGWKIKVDGELVKPAKALGSLIAVPSTEGFHELEFVYRPDSAVYGGIISIIGIVIFALFILWSLLYKKGKRLSDEGARVHFLYHKGDEVNAWTTEEKERLASGILDDEDDDEIDEPEESDEAEESEETEEPCETEASEETAEKTVKTEEAAATDEAETEATQEDKPENK